MTQPILAIIPSAALRNIEMNGRSACKVVSAKCRAGLVGKRALDQGVANSDQGDAHCIRLELDEAPPYNFVK